MQPVERRQQRVRLQWGAVGLCHDKCSLTAEPDLWKIDILRRKAATSPPARRGGGGGYRGGGNFTAAVPEAVAFTEVVPSMRDVSTAAAIVAARVRHIPSQADRGVPDTQLPIVPIARATQSQARILSRRSDGGWCRGYGFSINLLRCTPIRWRLRFRGRILFGLNIRSHTSANSGGEAAFPFVGSADPLFIHVLVIQNGLIYIKAGERFSISLACVQGPRLIARLFG